MRKILWVTVPASIVIAGAGIYLAAAKPVPGAAGPDSASFNMAVEPRHPVTEDMVVDAGGRAGNRAPDFDLKDASGKSWTLKDLTKSGPAVLVMTMDGCPCSVESQPYFNDIAKALEGRVAFAGIFNKDQTTATLYQKSLGVPYPLLCETGKSTYQAYEAEQSVYTYLVGQDGVIVKVWPGYNGAMLAELTQMAASLAKAEGPALSFKDAPSELSSGCFFFHPEKNLREGTPKAQ